MANGGWVQTGRELIEQTTSLRKSERLALVRQRAKELGRSPHTIGRFLVLAEFLTHFELTSDEEERLPIGVIEIVYRLHSKDRSMAEAMLKELIEHGMTFREALRREAILTQSQAPSAEYAAREPSTALAEKIWRAIGEGAVEDVRYVSDRSDDWRVASISSFWSMDAMPIAFITERDPLYLSKRGFKNFVRNIIIASFEYEWVVVEFTSQGMFDHYQSYIANVPDKYKEDIKIYLGL